MSGMVRCMKTTLNIDDRILKEAKKLAAERGVTLTSIVEDGLRAVLNPPTEYRFEFPTVPGKLPPDLDITSREAMYDWFDRNP